MIWGREIEEELINLYNSNVRAVSIFANKYKIYDTTIYYRLKKLGIKRRGSSESKIGILAKEKHFNWKGGINKTSDGYVKIRVSKGKYKAEHILVMEKKLGRKLKRNEIVHHIDESFEGRSVNKEGNLQLTNRSDHMSHHKRGKGKGYSISFHKRYNKWQLEIGTRINGDRRYIGSYKTEEEALRVIEQRYGILIKR